MPDRSRSRRSFLKRSAVTAGALTVAGPLALRAAPAPRPRRADLYPISLAQWSLHRMLRAGELDPAAFPAYTKETFDIDAVEYVNQFYADKKDDDAYFQELKQRTQDAGVTNVLIMCDAEGALGDPDEAARLEAVENHYKWVDHAALLGCHSIRVNAQSRGSYAEQQRLAADGLRRLAEYADERDVNVIVENHGGLSSNGMWLAGTIFKADHPRVGTLPDFGNFRIGEGEEYDRYKGVLELMPFARGVSAKSYAFDAEGECIETDYDRMMRIVLNAGYRGHVGIEYEGDGVSEVEGIRATKTLLERVAGRLAGEFETDASEASS